MAPAAKPYALAGSTLLPGERRPLLGRRSAVEIKRDALAPVLAELAESGWRSLHGVSFGMGPIDHVLVGPRGIATVETRRRWGPVNVARLDERLLERVYTQAKLVTVTCGRAAAPVLVFPWAHLRPGPVSRRCDVDVVSLDALAGHLEQREQRFSPAQVSKLVRILRGAAEPVD